MDHSRRGHVRILDFDVRLTVLPVADGVELEVETEGCDRVPVKIEFVCSSGGTVTGESFVVPGNAGNNITVTSGMVQISKDSSRFEIGPAFGSHHYTAEMRGSEPPSSDEFTIYFTGFTPIRKRITIKKATQ
jgi:hypothetical protein